MATFFSDEEIVSRQQFSSLFCEGRIFCRCGKAEALNEDEWTIPIIDDILHQVFPGNVLAMDSVDTLVRMLGWDQAGLYFTCLQTSEVVEFVLPYISPYISNRSFIKLKLIDQDKTISNCGQFYNTFFLESKHPWVKITRKDLYKLYQLWCTKTENYPVSLNTFTQAFEHFGHRLTKGYLNGMCGVNYYEMKFSPAEVRKYVQPQVQETKIQEGTNSSKPLRDVGRTRDKILQPPVQRKESHVSPIKGGQNVTTGDGRDSSKHVQNGTNNQKPDNGVNTHDNQHIGDTGAISSTEQIQNSSINRANDQLASLRNFPSTKVDPTGTDHKATNFPNDPTRILGRIKELPLDIRNFLSEYRLLYKTLEEYRDFTFFSQEMESNGFYQDEQEMHRIFALLIEYATHDLRELKKGVHT